MATIPMRVSQDLFKAAKAAGDLHSRSATQQLDYWARIGRALETAPGVTRDAVTRVLTGELAYDDVPVEAQAIVRTHWDAQIAGDLGALDLTAELDATGKPWYTADANGDVVVHHPTGG